MMVDAVFAGGWLLRRRCDGLESEGDDVDILICRSYLASINNVRMRVVERRGSCVLES